MWTCNTVATNILHTGLYNLNINTENKLENLLDIWKKLIRNDGLPFSVDKEAAIEAIRNIKILHNGYIKHNGGDAAGIHYANLWNSLLKPLKQYYQLNGEDYGDN
jgi:hypothetical protein